MILQESPGGGEPDGRPPERGRRMAIIVTVLGVVIALIGVIGLAHPPSLITLVQRWQSPARFWFAVVDGFTFVRPHDRGGHARVLYRSRLGS